MWTMTACLILILGAVVVAIVMVSRFLATMVVSISRDVAEVTTQTVERLIAPVVSPEPVRQVDVPEQTEMFTEPAWAKDWDQTER